KKGGRRQLGGRRVPRCKSTGLDFAGSGFGRRRRRTQPDTIQAFLIAIFFSLFCACTVLGSVTVSTPFLKFASILSVAYALPLQFSLKVGRFFGPRRWISAVPDWR